MELIKNEEFIKFSKMTNKERGFLIAKMKSDLESYFECNLIIHKYGSQPDNGNQMLSFNQHSELINIIEFEPR